MTDEDAKALVERGIQELRTAFDTFDTNRDGRLSPTELGEALASLGQPAAPHEVRKLIASVDRDGDGALDFDEFVLLVEPRPTGLDDEADLREAFAVLDANGDGFLDAAELRSAVAAADGLEEGDVAHILDSAGQEGRISWPEFRDLVLAVG